MSEPFDLRDMPDDLPRAYSFELGMCSDPLCGPHIVLLDRSGTPIAEMVLGRQQAKEFIKRIQDVLYDKATQRS